MPKRNAGQRAALPDDSATLACWMRLALAEAEAAADKAEVPIGAIVVHADRVIGRGHNGRETLNDPTAHAEMIALVEAARHLGGWRLHECGLIVTLEPCLMCAGAMLQARLGWLCFAATDPKAGAVTSLYRVLDDRRLNHQIPVCEGILADEASRLLTQFFATQRAAGKK